MKALLVGSGGREHALAWKLRQDDPTLEIIAAPGNPGIATLGRCHPVRAADIDGLAALAAAERVDLTVVGPEVPLEVGIVDRFRAERRAIFGPTRAAAEIETSKAFAKQLMRDAGVPTAVAFAHRDADGAKRAARTLGAPVVIKASGLAAGKGVVVCETLAEADAAIDAMLRDGAFGDAGAEVLVEEFMDGEELSLFAVTDGERVVMLLPAQDHKRLLDGDLGPNTGGMGAYAPVATATPYLLDQVERRVLAPTLAALRAAGRPFTGLLYAGLMLTRTGPRVVEFNCRFGDPETEAILPLMESSLLELLVAVATGDGLAGAAPARFSDRHAVTTVVAAPGYPGESRLGGALVLPAAGDGIHVFHAGTTADERGILSSSGGRVLAVTAVADTLAAAQARSNDHVSRISFEGMQYRRDVGWRELARHAGAP
jgi:phosphoribosylamine--glycine ligase